MKLSELRVLSCTIHEELSKFYIELIKTDSLGFPIFSGRRRSESKVVPRSAFHVGTANGRPVFARND